MHFLSHLNLIGIIFLSGVLAAGYWFFFYDKSSDIIQATDNLRNEIIQTDKKIKKKTDEIQKAITFDSSVKQLGQELQLFYEYFPHQLTNRQLFQDLTRLSKNSGLDIISMSGSPRQKQTDLYETLVVKLTVEGEFAQFLSFLSKLTSLNKVVTVQNVNIQPVNRRNQIENAKIQKIRAQINVSGFRYVQPVTVQDENAKQNKQT